MNNEAVEGIADAHAPRFSVKDNTASLLRIAGLIEVCAHHTGTGLYHRHAGRISHEINQPTAATRDTQVNIADGRQQRRRGLMCGGQQRHGSSVHTIAAENFVYHPDTGTIRLVGITATFQNTGVAALEAQREYIERDIRPCLIYHSNHAERHANLLQHQPVCQSALHLRPAERRRQPRHSPHVGRNGLQTVFREHQTVVKRIAPLHLCQIFGVGPKQRFFVIHNRVGHAPQHFTAFVVRHQREPAPGFLCLYECFCHDCCYMFSSCYDFPVLSIYLPEYINSS